MLEFNSDKKRQISIKGLQTMQLRQKTQKTPFMLEYNRLIVYTPVPAQAHHLPDTGGSYA